MHEIEKSFPVHILNSISVCRALCFRNENTTLRLLSAGEVYIYHTTCVPYRKLQGVKISKQNDRTFQNNGHKATLSEHYLQVLRIILTILCIL